MEEESVPQDAFKAFRKMLKETHEIKQIADSYSDYNGRDITHSRILSQDDHIKDAFTIENLHYHEERGRDFMAVILHKMYQLGFNDGLIEGDEKVELWKMQVQSREELINIWKNCYLDLKNSK